MRKTVKELPAEYRIQISKNLEELEEVKSFWEKKQTHPDGDLNLLINMINSKKEIVSPYVILILLHKKPEALMVGIIEKKRISVNISYKKISGPKLRILTIIPDRIFGNPNFICSHFFVSELIASLKRKEADLVQLESFNIDSDIYKITKTIPGFISRDYYPETISHWKTKLPGNLDELFAKSRKGSRLSNS